MLGLAIGLAPTLSRVFSARPPWPSWQARATTGWHALLVALAVAALWLTSASVPLAVACVVLAVVAAYRRSGLDRVVLAGALAAFAVSALLPWWRRPVGSLEASVVELGVMALLAGVSVHVLLLPDRPTRARWPLLVCFASVAFVFSFATGIFHSGDVLLTAWHHWGAYVGPAEALRAGLRVFRDVPAQYGLGPTALIGLSCGESCWQGMYYVVGLTTWSYTLVVGWVAWRICGRDSATLKRALVLLVCLLTTLLWTSYPPLASSATVTPSVGGMRFLPALVLVALLIRSKPGPAPLWGYFGWAFAVLWSPESAFCSTFVWWPYVLWSSAASAAPGRAALRAVSRQSAVLIGSVAGLVLVFLAVYWLVYRTTPTVYGLFAYVINPPGPLPINPRGAVWFFAAVMVCGLATLWAQLRHRGDSHEFRTSFVLVLLAYSSFSYFLGRSHDNNLLNLLPFQFLVLLSTLRAPLHRAWQVAAASLLAGMVGWCSVFGFGIFQTTVSQGDWLELSPATQRAAFSFANEHSQELIRKRFGPQASDPADVARAIATIQQTFHEPVTVLDGSMNMAPSDPGDVWSAIHGPANFTFIPSRRRQQFLRRTAAQLRRCGWLVVDKQYPASDWLIDFAAAYRTEEESDFGSYRAIRLRPKVLSGECPAL